MSERLSLSQEAGRMLIEDFQKELDREQADPEYMAQSAFPDCYSRMKAMFDRASVRPLKFVALAAVYHREDPEGKHVDNRAGEREGLVTAMTQEDAVIAANSFWNW